MGITVESPLLRKNRFFLKKKQLRGKILYPDISCIS